MGQSSKSSGKEKAEETTNPVDHLPDCNPHVPRERFRELLSEVDTVHELSVDTEFEIRGRGQSELPS